MTEREKEMQKAAEARAARKRLLMQEIQDDIDARRKNKEAQEVAEKAERERLRREQLEYETIQKGMAEELKRQLMDILKENQSIADTRTENAIQREALENQVTEMEKKAAEAKQEVADTIETARYTAKVIEGPEEQPSLAKAVIYTAKTAEAPKEAAGKASTVKEGGLAKLVFG